MSWPLLILLSSEMETKKDIDIVVFVTQTPDYLMPSCSNIIYEKLELKRVHLLRYNWDVLAMFTDFGISHQ